MQNIVYFIGLFCKRDLSFKEPTSHSHPISFVHGCVSVSTSSMSMSMSVSISMSVSVSVCMSASVSAFVLVFVCVSVCVSACSFFAAAQRYQVWT